MPEPTVPDRYSPEHFNTLAAMSRFGGSFVQALAEAWRRADSQNHAKLYAAFHDYYDAYKGMSGPNT